RELFRPATAVIDPNLDELRLDADIVAHGFSSFLDRRHRIRYVRSGWMPICAGSGPSNSRPRRLEQRRARNDFISYTERYISPIRSAAVEVRAIDEITDSDDRAEPVISETLQLIDDVLACEVFLCHRAVEVVLVSDMAVQIDLC